MEGILVCCQRNEFRVSSCIVRNGEKIICYSTFPYHSWFYELSCVLSQLFLFPDCKELVYLISYYIHAMLMIYNATATNDSSSYIHQLSERSRESYLKDGLDWVEMKTYLFDKPSFLYIIWVFLQRKGIHRHEILQSVPLPFFHYKKLLNSLVHSSSTLMGKSNGVLSLKKKLISSYVCNILFYFN